jgi:hypothetical protein
MDEKDKLITSLNQEIEHLKQIMWAMAYAAGGRISIPYSIWAGPDRNNELLMWEDVQNMAIVIKAVEHGKAKETA